MFFKECTSVVKQGDRSRVNVEVNIVSVGLQPYCRLQSSCWFAVGVASVEEGDTTDIVGKRFARRDFHAIAEGDSGACGKGGVVE